MVQTKLDNNTTGVDLFIELSNEIKHKVILVTGVSPGGLGAWSVEAIAKASPKLVILASRDVKKALVIVTRIKEAKDGVETRILHLDRASLKSVRRAADEILEFPEAIDVLVNNIGIMATPYSKTEDDFESQWQTNYLGPFLFTNLIIDKLLASGPDGRVVNVSSEDYRGGGVRYQDYSFHGGDSYNPRVAYAASKTALILYTKELARHLGKMGLTTVSICPDAVMTGLQSHGAMEVFGAVM
ncbi:retinol dehydrogenase 13 [Colletotrichum liriopes]|uniref:Retinol dehydrogenase 13 n=1 Tax=Colletotrichum liriopes TaxID=708192 RepID=A0AA37GVB8_9PEZI|nr:retinol dehydrogenase 13 [Colletotrichum liriopes]